jgi:hypothetical protein
LRFEVGSTLRIADGSVFAGCDSLQWSLRMWAKGCHVW